MLFLTAGGIIGWSKLRSPHIAPVPRRNASGQVIEKIQGLGRGCSFLDGVTSGSVLRRSHWPEKGKGRRRGGKDAEGEAGRMQKTVCGRVGRELVVATLKVLIVSEGGET